MQFKNFTFFLLGLGLASAVALPHNELPNSEKDAFELGIGSEILAPPPPGKSTTAPKPKQAPKPSPPKPNSAAPPPNKKKPRSFTTIKASPEAWKRYSRYCSQKVKRSLERRDEVPRSYGNGGYASQDGPFKSGSKIWTDKLRSCTGLVIQGKLMGVALTSYLVHFSTTQTSLDAAMEKLENQVKGIKHESLKGYISEPDTTKDLPPELNNPGDKELMEKIGALIRERVHELTGSAPVTRKRAVTAFDTPGNKVNGYMWVDEHNQVFIDGHKVS